VPHLVSQATMPATLLVQNLNRNIGAPPRVAVCDTFASRLRGLMFRRALTPDEGVLLTMPRESRLDSSIHMFFVRFDLAVFWINASMQVVDRIFAKSWHAAYIPSRPAKYVLELHPSQFPAYQTGEHVEFRRA